MSSPTTPATVESHTHTLTGKVVHALTRADGGWLTGVVLPYSIPVGTPVCVADHPQDGWQITR